ncbi:MAG: hypothetical protein EHM88_20830, partial [Candidatus Rokuibacteriota bacterium]
MAIATGAPVITAVHPCLGVEVAGVDLTRPLDDDVFARIADGDLVMLAFVREYPEPSDPSTKYTTPWFAMFRPVDVQLGEHWAPAMPP